MPDPNDHPTSSASSWFSRLNLGLSTKIAVTSVAILVAVISVNYWVFLRGYRVDAQAAMVKQAEVFTAVASAAMDDASEKLIRGEINTEALVADALAEIEQGGHYADTRYFASIPVITGWHDAKVAAEAEGLNFRITALEARNPDNAAEPGTFRHQLISDLTEQVKNGGDTGIYRENTDTNTIHYMRAIQLNESCMSCHGDPAVYDVADANGHVDGRDVLGFRMESWPVGYMHGAYEVELPLETVDAQVGSFFQTGMIWTLPLVIVACGGFVFLLRVLLARPLTALIAIVRDIAEGEGDLTTRMNMTRTDEIGRLGMWFDKFMGGLQEIMGEVRDATTSVASASAEIAASAEQMAAGLTSQETQTEQVSAAVEQMSHSVREVANRSKDAANAAEKSKSSAESGGGVVSQTVEEMEGIASEVRASSESVVGLGRKGESIGEIIEVINDIADQTNLLALNAAIEAARAGEHGRGFAVVADEVRKLAERTQGATEEVATSIREIQGETSSAVTQIEQGSERVGRGVELANTAGSALHEIVASSDEVQTMVNGIAAAADEQSAASEEIARNIEQISAVTRESSEGANQASQAAVDLSQQADRLQSLVGRFKI